MDPKDMNGHAIICNGHSIIVFLAAIFLGFAATPSRADDLPTVSFEAFELEDLSTHTLYKSADHANAAFLVDFFFASCPACNSNAPTLRELAEEFYSERVQVTEYTIDCEADEHARWLSAHGPMAGPTLNGCDHRLRTDLGIRAFPTMVVFDCEKRERYRHVGTLDRGDRDELRELLTELQFMTCARPS